jgi:hypothetical protein
LAGAIIPVVLVIITALGVKGVLEVVQKGLGVGKINPGVLAKKSTQECWLKKPQKQG